jgi:GTP-binding protein EngB required for normal cell division
MITCRIQINDQTILENPSTPEQIELVQLLEEEEMLISCVRNQVDIVQSIVGEELQTYMQRVIDDINHNMFIIATRLDKMTYEGMKELQAYSDIAVAGSQPQSPARPFTSTKTTSGIKTGMRNICRKGKDMQDCIGVNLADVKAKLPKLLRREFDTHLKKYYESFE